MIKPDDLSGVDLRLLRYLAAVAEAGSMTRAAKRLGITQPALSRAVRALEDEVGVELLARGTHAAEPTPAGKILVEAAHGIDQRLRGAVAGARATAAARPLVRLAVSGCDVPLAMDLVAAYQGSPAGAHVDFVVDDASGPDRALRDGAGDVALARQPFDPRGLDWEPLRPEPRVVLLPRDHALAARSELRLADLVDEPVTRWPGMTRAEAAYWAGADTDGHEWRDGPDVARAAEVLTAVRLGRAVAFVPASVVSPAEALAGLVVRPVADLSPSVLCVVWPQSTVSVEIASFVDALSRPGDGRPGPAGPW